MNWDDTIGKRVHVMMCNKALEQQPDIDRERLEQSIKRTSLSVGITRQAVADVLEAETESLAMMHALGDHDISVDFISGMLAATSLVRTGKHVTDQ